MNNGIKNCSKKMGLFVTCLLSIFTPIFRPFEGQEGSGPRAPSGQGGQSSPVPQPSSGIKSVR